MDVKDLVKDALGRVHGTLQRVVSDLTFEQMLYRPSADTSSIAWLIWHLTRVQDHHISDLANLPQAWVREGWHAKFNMPPNPLDTGTGHTPDQVAMLNPSTPGILLNYHVAVYENTKSYLDTISQADLDLVLDEPQYQPIPTVGVRLVSIISDNTQHAGQAAYLRGLIQGKGWMAI